MITLNLPFPISVNALYFNQTGKGRAKTARYRTWVRNAGNEILAQKPGLPIKKIHGPYKATLLVQAKIDKRKRDLSNLWKGVGDLLVEHNIIDDDHLEQEIHLAWSHTVTGCRVIIETAKQEQEAA